MKKEYLRPEITSRNTLHVNEATASCQYFSANTRWSFINYGGAEANEEYMRTNFFDEFDQELSTAGDHLHTYEDCCARTCGVYLVEVDDQWYWFEDWYPHMEPTMAAWETAEGRVIPPDLIPTEAVDNWQDVHGGDASSLPVLPGEGYTQTVFHS